MAADYIRLYTRVWRDPWFRALDAPGKLLFLYLLSGDPAVGMTGIYEFNAAIAGAELGDPFAAGRLEQFISDGKVQRDRDWIWVVNYSHHQLYTLKQFNSARVEARKLAKKTRLSGEWLKCYPEFDTSSGQCFSQLSKSCPDEPNRADSAQMPLLSSPLLSPKRGAATATPPLPAGNPWEEIPERADEFATRHLELATRLAEHGFRVTANRRGDRKTIQGLAMGAVLSGGQYDDLEAALTWANSDPRAAKFWQGQIVNLPSWSSGKRYETLLNQWRAAVQPAPVVEVDPRSLDERLAPKESLVPPGVVFGVTR